MACQYGKVARDPTVDHVQIILHLTFGFQTIVEEEQAATDHFHIGSIIGETRRSKTTVA
jgi:hypothetical protein